MTHDRSGTADFGFPPSVKLNIDRIGVGNPFVKDRAVDPPEGALRSYISQNAAEGAATGAFKKSVSREIPVTR